MNESHQRPVGFVSQDFLDGKWNLDHIAKTDTGQISRVIPVFTRAQPSAEPDTTDIADRLESLIPQGDGYNSEYAHTLVEAVEALRKAKLLSSAEIEALRRDAARYRWLSNQATQQADARGPIFRIDVRRNMEDRTLFNVDAAIDAAIARQEAGHDA